MLGDGCPTVQLHNQAAVMVSQCVEVKPHSHLFPPSHPQITSKLQIGSINPTGPLQNQGYRRSDHHLSSPSPPSPLPLPLPPPPLRQNTNYFEIISSVYNIFPSSLPHKAVQ